MGTRLYVFVLTHFLQANRNSLRLKILLVFLRLAHQTFRIVPVPENMAGVEENSPSNLASRVQPSASLYSKPTVVSAPSRAGFAELTRKFDPGSDWKKAVAFPSLSKSCAQARRE